MFRFATIFMLVFSIAVTWMIGPLFLSGGSAFYQLIRAQSYPTTTGAITQSAITQGVWSARYSYRVADRSYENAADRLGDEPIDNDRREQRLLARHPVGSTVIVHYDPRDPQRALLDTALHGWDVVFVAFSIMPLSFMGGAWAGFFTSLMWDQRDIRIGGCQKSTDASGATHLRMPGARPLHLLQTLALLVPFLSLFATFIGVMAMGAQTVSLPAGIFVLLCTIAIIVGFPLRSYYKLRRGDHDLVVDQRDVSMPATFGRKQRYARRIDEIKTIWVQYRYQPGKGGGAFYSVWLYIHQQPNEQIAEYRLDQERAESLARWLGDKLKKHVQFSYAGQANAA